MNSNYPYYETQLKRNKGMKDLMESQFGTFYKEICSNVNCSTWKTSDMSRRRGGWGVGVPEGFKPPTEICEFSK